MDGVLIELLMTVLVVVCIQGARMMYLAVIPLVCLKSRSCTMLVVIVD